MSELRIKKEVLLGEDNSSHAKLITRCFDKGLVNISHQNDGEKVLNDLQFRLENDLLPDALLLDLKLPRVDGLEVLRRIKANPDLLSFPVIILSSSNHPTDIAVAVKHGADGYFVKPYEFDKMRANIQTISESLVENKIPRGLLDDMQQQQQ